MSRPRLIVHIGTQKTGSSSLQKTLRDQRDALLVDGILYPRLERSPHAFKHVSVSRVAKRGSPEQQAQEEAALREEFAASGAHTLILSEESFWRPDTSSSRFFERFRPDFEVEVVAYLRRPDLYLESLYNQTLRTGLEGECRTLDAYARDERVRGQLDYASVLAGWQAVADRVHVFDFEREVKGRGLVASFFEGLGLPVRQAPGELQAKKSPDGNAVLALRWLRELQIPHDMNVVLDAADTLAREGGLAPRKFLLGRDERARVLAESAACCAALAQGWGIHFSETLPDEPAELASVPQAPFLAHLLGALSLQAEPAGKSRDGPAQRRAQRQAERQADRRAARRRARESDTAEAADAPAPTPES